MKATQSIRRPLASRTLLVPLAGAVLPALVIAITADGLDGWGTLAALLAAAALLVGTVLAWKLHEWRRPFSWEDLRDDPIMSGVPREAVAGSLTPHTVEQALRHALVVWASELQVSGESTVLFHPNGRADYDARIIDPDGGENGTRICLVQAKARPIPATLYRFAEVRAREDAHEAVLFTVRANFAFPHCASLVELAGQLGIRLASVEHLDATLRGDSPTIEVYAEPRPPGAKVPALAGL